MFSDRQLRALKPRDVPYRVYEGASDPGFGVQVLRSGKIIFFQQYNLYGKRRFYTVGEYPLFGLADARKAARAVRRSVAGGQDPRHRGQPATVEDVFRGYVAHMRRLGKGSADEVERALLREEDFREYLPRPASSLTGADVRDILRRILARGKEMMANRLRSYILSAYRWAIRHDNDPRRTGPAMGVTRNPVEDVPVPARETPGQRALSWEEVKDAWNADIPLLYRAAIRLAIATGQRPGEVTGARWSSIEDNLWTIIVRKGKAPPRPHVVPLTPLAMSILEEVRALVPEGDYLFPLQGKPERKRPFLKTTLPQVIRKAGQSWTPRDLRRTVKTLMGEAGVDKFTRDRIQGHAINDVSGKHYDRYSYLAEKRAGLEKWEAALRLALRPQNPL